jgi:hypothetical protein
MKIESTTFGAIAIDGKTYEHDVVVRLSGEIVKRKKKLFKKLYGTSHVLSEDEARFLFEKGATRSSSARVRWATCTCHRKPKPISKERAARS